MLTSSPRAASLLLSPCDMKELSYESDEFVHSWQICHIILILKLRNMKKHFTLQKLLKLLQLKVEETWRRRHGCGGTSPQHRARAGTYIAYTDML